ncbi:ATP-binding protein [Streptosporangium sp. NPDC000095]|uniref:ATP-binding protein n=1 Tax=Streptosporangium sp. NPDC000095 TaxID=3366184 RepID=UPI0036796E2F
MSESMLLEREKELARAEQAVQAAVAGNGSMMAVIGPPGVGKSALLRTLADAAAPHARVLRAGGTLLEQDFAFGVVQQLFEPILAGAEKDRWDTWFQGTASLVQGMFFGESHAIGPNRSLRQESVLQGLNSLIANLSEDGEGGEGGEGRALVVVVDDLQWADAPSLRWLAYLARRLDGTRVLVAAAFSEECAASDPMLLREIAASGARTLHPRPLSVGGVRRLIGEEFGESCDLEFARACHEVSGGIPASLAAMLHRLRTAGFQPVAARAGEVHAASQPFLRDRRMFCLGIQPVVVRDLAQAMVVLGDLAEPELISELAGLDSIDYKSAMQTLDRLGLLAGGESPRFVHQSVRYGIESGMSTDTRASMHRRAASLLHTVGHPAEHVADQLLQVTAGYEAWEIGVLRAAAGAALERGAGRKAARYIRHALLDRPPDSEARGRLLVDLAAAERGFDLASSVTHISQAVPMLTSVTERAEAVLWIPPAIGTVNPSSGALVQDVARQLHERGPSYAQGDLGLRLEARTRCLGMQDAAHLGAAADRLRGFGAEVPVSTGSGRELLAVLAYAATMTGEVTAAEISALAGRILEREPPRAGHAYTALPLLVQALVLADTAASVTPWLEAMREQAQRQELEGVIALVNAERSMVLRASGHVVQARSTALSVADNAGSSWPEARTLSIWTLAMIALETQDVELGERVIRTSPESGDLRVVVAHRMVRGMLDAVRGDLPAALHRFLDSGRQLSRCGWTNAALYPWRVWAAAVNHRLGRVQAATELADEEYAFAWAWGAPATYGRALRLRGMITPGEEGVDLLKRAVETLRRSEDRIELSRTLTLLGRRLAELGADDAEEFVSEGTRVARERGVSWAEGDRDSELNGPALRLSAPERGELTKTEETVVAFVLRGWTNQRIADSLGVTRRAVEKSLTSTYRKLGVSGRAALVEELGARNADE